MKVGSTLAEGEVGDGGPAEDQGGLKGGATFSPCWSTAAFKN